MPFNCEDCGDTGARLNRIIEIRLCEKCNKDEKYKLICKSEALKKYKLTKLDLDNYPYEEFIHTNPIYRSAHPMNLYYVREIKNYFIDKHDDIIRNKLFLHDLNLTQDDKINQVITYLEQEKISKKENKYNKILDKLKINLDNLPKHIKDELKTVKSGVEFEKIIKSYMRRKELYFYLKNYNLEKHIDLDICDYYVDENTYTLEQIKNYIIFFIQKKKMIKEAIKDNKLPIKKYSIIYNNFINSTTEHDINKIIELVKDREYRFTILVKRLKDVGLELRNDSVLCNNYLNGSDECTIDYVINTMIEMNWFFIYGNYSHYTKEYDEIKKQERRDNYEYYGYNRYHRDDENYIEERNDYNQRKSEYAKNKSIINWIINGKKELKPPDSLNNKIIELEEKLNKKQVC